MSEKKLAIRFGLGAIKAVGLAIMEKGVESRKEKGDFVDIFDFAKKMDAKSVNKKSVEALAKAGAFQNIANNRRQIFESFDIISAYATQQENEANSNQMTFFGELIDEEKSKPELKKVDDWSKPERLQREFEAFGFFLNEHPLDDSLDDLRKRGVVFCDKIEKDEFDDGDTVKMAGVVANSKHRSSARGRFAYINISDPYGIFETMVFDEALITQSRDLLADGSAIAMECYIRKDEGGIRIMIREVQKLEDFIKSVSPQDEPFEDIKKRSKRRNYSGGGGQNNSYNKDKKGGWQKSEGQKSSGFSNSSAPQKSISQRLAEKKIVDQAKITIEGRDPIFEIKSFLSRRVAPKNFAKTTEVILCVNGVDIELPQEYLLDEADLKGLRAIGGVLQVD